MLTHDNCLDGIEGAIYLTIFPYITYDNMISLVNFVSSANRYMNELTASSKSFMYTRKSNGPRTLPWVIPLSTGLLLDLTLLTTTIWLQTCRNTFIYFNTLPSIPYLASFFSSRRCGTVSDASAKSKSVSLHWKCYLSNCQDNSTVLLLQIFLG